LQKDIASASADVAAAAAQPPAAETALKGAVSSEVWKNATEPTFGGTLNATTERAEEEARKAEEEDRNHVTLSHSNYIGDNPPIFNAPFNATSLPAEEPSIANPIQEGTSTVDAGAVQPPTLAELDQQNRTSQAGISTHELPPLPPMPPLPDFSTLPPLPPVPGAEDGGAPSSPPPAQPSVPQDPSQFRIPGSPAA
jgi:hypothetical protein